MTRRRSRPEERGQAAVLVTALLPVVVLGVALAVDIGRVAATAQALQSAVDAAALAGARVLYDDAPTESRVRSAAVEVGALNAVPTDGAGAALTLDANAGNAAGGGVVLGTWDRTTRVFSPAAAGADVRSANAVQVNARLTGGRAWMPSAFARFVGLGSVTMARSAVAVLNGSAARTPTFPLALDASLFANVPRNLSSPVPFTVSEENDAIAWTGFFGGTNAAAVRAFILNPQTIPRVRRGDVLNTSNGTMDSCYQTAADADLIGKVLVVPVADLHGGVPGTVRGFAAIEVTAIDPHGKHSSISGQLVRYATHATEEGFGDCFSLDCQVSLADAS